MLLPPVGHRGLVVVIRTAIGLYTLRELGMDLPSVLEVVERTGFHGVEFAAYRDTPTPALVSAFDETQLDLVGVHVDVTHLLEDLDAVLDRYGELDTSRIVAIPYGKERYEDVAAVDRRAERLNEVATRLADEDLDLAYHHLTCELDTVKKPSGGEELVLDRLVRELDGSITLEFDTGLALWRDLNPIALLTQYGDRIDAVHFTDTRKETVTRHVELGAGELDLQATMETIQAVDPEWIVYEHGATNDPLASLEHADALFHGSFNLVPRGSGLTHAKE